MILKQNDIMSLANLRTKVKNPKRIEAVSQATGIDSQYLVLLRREIESYFPKPFALKDFDWLPRVEIAKLEANGIRDTAALYNMVINNTSKVELARSMNLDITILETLASLVDLTRIQWVSPTAARMLAEATYESAAKVAHANAEDLYKALDVVNKRGSYFKGKIGLRDVKRLIYAASCLPS
jgi:hypothetical protein